MGFTPAKHNPSPSHLPPRYALTLYALGVLKVEEKILLNDQSRSMRLAVT